MKTKECYLTIWLLPIVSFISVIASGIMLFSLAIYKLITWEAEMLHFMNVNSDDGGSIVFLSAIVIFFLSIGLMKISPVFIILILIIGILGVFTVFHWLLATIIIIGMICSLVLFIEEYR